ncbi:MAG: hypothetical protein LQ344_000183 [Seirophora lacunosa]|nr:MAG: hypothetical protein LQ344_000183 [Seirophora lacunosa]
MQAPSDQTCLSQTQQHALRLISESQEGQRVLPHATGIRKANRSLVSSLPSEGHGIKRTTEHVLEDLAPALNHQALSPSYYGFVTGGVTPAARVAEEIVSAYDQNVVVHLPETTIATTVEDHALTLLLQLFHFSVKAWPGRTFTTGATSSNVMGLACGREHIINAAIQKRRKHSASQTTQTVGELGLIAACREANIADIQILTTLPHSSLKKAASIVGLGRSCFHRVSRSKDGLEFDLDMLEEQLKRPHSASIVVISCAEVNTGFFATHSYGDVDALRALCDNAGDAHKLLNVPYDCGFFFCRHAGLTQKVFQNVNAAYLNAGSPGLDLVESPLNVGIENSRRFRALPVYATLVSYGRRGYQNILQRQIWFARRVAWYFSQHEDFELLPQTLSDRASIDRMTYIIVLFRAKDEALNHTLVKRINDSSQIYVTGTSWNEVSACRIAAANWQVDPERDSANVESVMERVLQEWRHANL